MFKQELLKVYFIAGSQDVPNKNLYTVLEEVLQCFNIEKKDLIVKQAKTKKH